MAGGCRIGVPFLLFTLSFYFPSHVFFFLLSGGSPHPKGMFPEALPDWLAQYSERIGKLKLFASAKFQAPNHVLINEYPAGQGIMVDFLSLPFVTFIAVLIFSG